MSKSNDRDSDQDTVLETFENITRGVARLWSKAKRKRGLITALVLLLLAAGLGYEARSVVSPSHSGLPGATTISGNAVGVIDGATITNTDSKTPPGRREQQYMVYVSFPDPRNSSSCGPECLQAVSNVTQGDGCTNGMCNAQFKNVDEGGKVDSTTLQNACNDAIKSGRKFIILFSGSRNQQVSDYSNMLLMEPSSD